MQNRMRDLIEAFREKRSDAVRYRVGELVRGFGFIDFNDFCATAVLDAQIQQIEEVLGLCTPGRGPQLGLEEQSFAY